MLAPARAPPPPRVPGLPSTSRVSIRSWATGRRDRSRSTPPIRPSNQLPSGAAVWSGDQASLRIYAPPITDSLRARVLASESSMSQSELSDAIDLLLLAGPWEDLPVAGVAAPPVKPAQGFAKEQNEQVQRFIDYAADKDTRRRGVVSRRTGTSNLTVEASALSSRRAYRLTSLSIPDDWHELRHGHASG